MSIDCSQKIRIPYENPQKKDGIPFPSDFDTFSAYMKKTALRFNKIFINFTLLPLDFFPKSGTILAELALGTREC